MQLRHRTKTKIFGHAARLKFAAMLGPSKKHASSKGASGRGLKERGASLSLSLYIYTHMYIQELYTPIQEQYTPFNLWGLV